jgi:hypothetical protein
LFAAAAGGGTTAAAGVATATGGGATTAAGGGATTAAGIGFGATVGAVVAANAVIWGAFIYQGWHLIDDIDTPTSYRDADFEMNQMYGQSTPVEASGPTSNRIAGFSPQEEYEPVTSEVLARLGGVVPRGFSGAEQFAQATSELSAALEASGVTDGTIGVRGSSVTGVGYRTGAPFSAASDIDFYVVSGQLTDGLKESRSNPGFVHPNRIDSAWPLLASWGRSWSDILGRKVSVAGFVPGMEP